jgi:hypothetical protein
MSELESVDLHKSDEQVILHLEPTVESLESVVLWDLFKVNL